MTVHLKFGGSTAQRTIYCPGWHAQAEALPTPPDSDAAREGEALHAVMESALLADDSFDPYAYVGTEVAGVTVTEDHIQNKIIPALDAWDELCERFNIEDYAPEVFVQIDEETGGTADIVAASADTSIVVDWKFGDGVMVDAKDNMQGLFYALCGWRTEEVADLFEGRDKLVIAIIQPTSRPDQETLKVWETDSESVRRFETRYMATREVARRVTADDHEQLNPGAWCRFCPAQAVCPAKQGLVEEQKRFPLDSLHIGTLGDALKLADDLEQWVAAVRKMAHEQMEQGVKLDGWKLVSKRAYRHYTSEAAVEEIVRRSRKLKREETHKSELLSPAQLEKVYRVKGLDFSVIEEHITKVSSGTTIAPASDPRPEAPAVGALRALAARTAG